jgi:hypothetical protein
LLRRFPHEVKERRFLRPGEVAAIDWTDLPTTAAEEADVTPDIPVDVTIGTNDEIAVPLFAADLKCSVEVPGEDTLLALKAMKYKQEKEDVDDTEEDPAEEPKQDEADDSVEEYSNASVSKCSLDSSRGYCKYHAARRNKCRRQLPKIEFAALPTTTVGEQSSDDDTKEMDTVDKEEFNHKHPKSDFESWEMRK